MDNYIKTRAFMIKYPHNVCAQLMFEGIADIIDVRFSRLQGRQPKMMDNYIKTLCVYDIIIKNTQIRRCSFGKGHEDGCLDLHPVDRCFFDHLPTKTTGSIFYNRHHGRNDLISLLDAAFGRGYIQRRFKK